MEKTPWKFWSAAGRGYIQAASKVWFSGALVFCTVLVAIGLSVYFYTMPSLASKSPFAQQLISQNQTSVGSMHEKAAGQNKNQSTTKNTTSNKSAANATSQSQDGEAGEQNGEDTPTSATGLGGIARSVSPFLGGAIGGADIGSGASSSSGSSSDSSSSSSSSSGGNSSSGASSSGSNGGSGNSSNQGGITPPSSSNGTTPDDSNNNDNGSNTTPEPPEQEDPVVPEPAPDDGRNPDAFYPTPEMDEQLHQAALNQCALLDDYASQIYAMMNTYNQICMTTDTDAKRSEVGKAMSLEREMSIANQAYLTECGEISGTGGMPETSIYVDNYASVNGCYGYLIEYLYQLYDSYKANMTYENPADGEAAWRAYIPLNANGIPVSLENYEACRVNAGL